MTDRMAIGASWLVGKMKSEASVSAILRTSTGTTYEINPTPGQSIFEGQSYEDGSSVRIESRDFTVDIAELDGYFPQAGDTIEIDSMDAEYEVFAPDGDHAWRYSSASEKAIRIHTSRVNPTT